MKVGFFGGSFNPPTNAHINLAKETIGECYLDKVIFMPVGDSYNKENLAKAKDRYQMLKIACQDNKELEVSDLEINVKRRLYAIDAFELIEKTYKKDELYFIMGADNFINIVNWKESNTLLEKYKYIILGRKNIEIDKYINENEEINKIKENIFILNNKKYMEKSATNFRTMLKRKDMLCKDEIPKGVFEYIVEKGLYK